MLSIMKATISLLFLFCIFINTSYGTQEKGNLVQTLSMEMEKMENTIAYLKSKLETKVSQLRNELESSIDRAYEEKIKEEHIRRGLVPSPVYDLSYLPIGTILPYLPSPGYPALPDEKGIPVGWVSCDGQIIEDGPWENFTTPNLNDNENGKGLFLRGGNPDVAGTIEFDTIQNHHHDDIGHSHTDIGHVHTDSGHTHEDAGHTHKYYDYAYDLRSTSAPWGPPRATENVDEETEIYQKVPYGYAAIKTSYARIATGKANVQHGKAVVEGPVGNNVRIAEETRPTNMRILWIMKMQPAGWMPE